MGNYVACKKYKKKWQSVFINFTSTHLELTAKSYVAIGTGTLIVTVSNVQFRIKWKKKASCVDYIILTLILYN